MKVFFTKYVIIVLLVTGTTDMGPVRVTNKDIFKNVSLFDSKLSSKPKMNLTKEQIDLKFKIRHLELEDKLIGILNDTLKGTKPNPIKQTLINTGLSFLALLVAGILVALIVRALMLRFERRETRREAIMTAEITESMKLKEYGRTERPGMTLVSNNIDPIQPDGYLGQVSPICIPER